MSVLEVNLETSNQLEGMKSRLFQDTRVVPSTHMEWLPTTYNSSSRSQHPLLALEGHTHTRTRNTDHILIHRLHTYT